MSSSPFEQRMKELETRKQPTPASPFEQRMRELEAPPAQRMTSQPPRPQPPQTLGGAIVDFATGESRQTTATRALPSLAEFGVRNFLGKDSSTGKGLAASLALQTVYDPQEAASVLSWAAGKPVAVREDEAGNSLLELDGNVVVYNRPGMSRMDAQQMATGAAMFTPAGNLGRGATAGAGMLKVAAGSAGTQAAIEAGQAATGGEFNPGEVGIVGAIGGLGQGIASALVRLAPSLRQIVRQSEITEEVRSVVTDAAVRLGFSPEEITDEVIAQMRNEAGAAVSPDTMAASALEREFDIPLTVGERTGSDPQLDAEDMMRRGVRGQGAQKEMLNFANTEQRPKVQAAASRIQGDMGGPPIATPREAGENVVAAVQGLEEQLDAAVNAAYADVGDAAMKPEGLMGMLRATRAAASSVTFDRNLKGTQFVLDRAGRTLRILRKRGTDRIRPIHIQQIEQMRQGFRTAYESAENQADRAQVMQLKRAFDDYLDSAVARGMIEGDQDALEAMGRARDSMTEYASLFYPRNKKFRGGGGERDRAGALLQRIIYSNPTGEEVVNAILAGNSFSARSGVEIAKRFRQVLGAESPEWNQIRQAAFLRFIKTGPDKTGAASISADRSLSAFNKAMENNESLVRELFTQEEIGTIRRYLSAVKRTQMAPTRSRANPSGSAVTAMKEVGNMISRLFGVAGDPTLLVSQAGLETVSGFRSSAQAKQSVRPFEAIVSGRRGVELIPAGAVAGAQQTRQ